MRNERSGLTRFVTLKDEWVDLEIAPDDFVNVIGDFDAEGNCTVGTLLALACVPVALTHATDCNNNSLIHYPDTLVNITLITSTNHCLRKSILGERYRGVRHHERVMRLTSLLTHVHSTLKVQTRSTAR